MSMTLPLPTRDAALRQAHSQDARLGDADGYVQKLMQELDGAVQEGDRTEIVRIFTQMLAFANVMPASSTGDFFAACAAWAAFNIVDSSNAWGSSSDAGGVPI